MTSPHPLKMGCYYHIYNRGINGETLFRSKQDYTFFLMQYRKYVEPIAKTYGYCLLNNHFHLLACTRTTEEQEQHHLQMNVSSTFRVLKPGFQFGNLFNSYAKRTNKIYHRTGSLFEHPFGRKEVMTNSYLMQLIAYIHQNPGRHGLVEDFATWTYSSYKAIISQQPTLLQRDDVLAWFGGHECFLAAHRQEVEPAKLASLLEDYE